MESETIAMADQLVVDEDRRGYFRITWYLADEGEMGATLGDGGDIGQGEAPTERADYEHWLACKTCHESGAARDGNGFHRESEKNARVVLRQIREALKQDRPLPEWAKTALAAGWKPPKGWKA
mgnify:FL=1